jgi:hypothetical protein
MKVTIFLFACFLWVTNSLQAQDSNETISKIIEATSIQILIPANPSKLTSDYRKLSASYPSLRLEYFVPEKTDEAPEIYFNAMYYLYNLKGTDTTHKYDFKSYWTSYHDLDGYVVYTFKNYANYKNNQRITFSITIRRASNQSRERTVIMIKKYLTNTEYSNSTFATLLKALDNNFEYGDIRAKY